MTRLKFKPLLMVMSIALLLAACASSLTMSNDERSIAYAEYIVKEKLESMDRITAFRFYGFSALSDDNVIISTRLNRPYLITLQSNCFNIWHANAIRINNTGSSLKVKFDSLSVPQQSGMATKCFIKTIHKLTVEQKKTLLKIGKKVEEDEA